MRHPFSCIAICSLLAIPSMGMNVHAKALYSDEQPTNQLKKLHIPLAWEKGYSGKGVRIAIIDTGVNKNSKLLSNVKVRKTFTVDNPKTKINEGDVLDRFEEGHGTGVATIIGARPLKQSDDYSIISVAPKATLLSYKYKDGTEEGDVKELIEAINTAIDDDVDIINISSGLKSDIPALHKSIKRAIAQNIVVVASAGNNKQKKVTYPARYSEVIAVTSVSSKNKRSSFANYGKGLDFVAPGENIPTISVKGDLYEASGTSFATPFITGMVALLKEQYPYASPTQLKKKLSLYAKDLGVEGYDTSYGYGMPIYKYSKPTTSLPPTNYEVVNITDHEALLKFPKTTADTWDTIIVSLHGEEIGRTQEDSFKLRDLSSDIVQLIELRAVNQHGDSASPVEFTFATEKDTSPPKKASNIQMRFATNEKARITWQVLNTSDYAYAKIYLNGQYAGKSTTKSFTTKPLNRKKTYKVSIVLYDKSGLTSKATSTLLATN